jgi:lipopolysaccharide/colanic/teichoic acid biosynthesis glycosyltransferase
MKINHFLIYAISLISASTFLIYTPIWILIGNEFYIDLNSIPETIRNTTIANFIAFYCSVFSINRLQRYTQNSALSQLLSAISIIYVFMMVVFVFFRLSYSIKTIIIGYSLSLMLLTIIQSLNLNKRKLSLLVIPFGMFSRFEDNQLYKFMVIKKPILPNKSSDGFVVDFRTGNLPKKWESFVAKGALSGVPVYSANHLSELITGAVDVNHLMENNFGVLSPSSVYIFIKRVLDVLIVILILPIAIPLAIVVALFVVIDSEGGAIFKQKRIGYRGEEFYIYKFRSMSISQDKDVAKISDDHHRVTRVGKFIRKFRLDEIPQLWNVLNGAMSLIGPRPETELLHIRYEKEISFFNYRLIVRPGISGWAQVMQGYTSNQKGAMDKLAYDFYYIKHFSFWLDLLIVFRTIKVILFGMGAK